jgi:hypothetical protein
MVLPCGRSAHLELGWACGAGKRTLILQLEQQEPELMYLEADRICLSIHELLVALREPAAKPAPDSTYEDLCASWHAAQNPPRRMPWSTAVELLSIVKKLPADERERLLALDDAAAVLG